VNPVERHHRLTRIFISSCGLQGERRKGALDRLCRQHPELRGEVELLLSIHDSVVCGPHASSRAGRR
jgi:hypothetical protein